MTTLTIYTNTLTAVEREYGENVRYVESFNTWEELFVALGRYMDSYAWVEVKLDFPEVKYGT